MSSASESDGSEDRESSEREASLSNASEEDEELKQWELEVLARFPSMPIEVQNLILEECDLDDLAVLSRLDKRWHERISPILWRDLDFLGLYTDEYLIEAVRSFFHTCDHLLDSDPARFAALASHVRSLDVGRLLGINVVTEEDNELSDFFSPDYREGSRSVFDILAHFKNLEHLSVSVKSWWGWKESLEHTGKALGRSLTKLKTLKVGGQMPPEVLKGLVSAPDLQNLSLINLITVPGQDDGPAAVCFLTEEMCRRNFANLEVLHLCKLADLHGGPHEPVVNGNNDDDNDPDWASGMRWRFPRQSESLLLEEWALLLRHTSKTLKFLTLENRFLCSWGWQNVRDPFIDPGNNYPEDYGAHSIRESQRVLFPVLFNQEWPQLEYLKLVGMGKKESVDQEVAHLKARVHIEQAPARFQMMMGDNTPESVATPYEFTGVLEEDDDELVEHREAGEESSDEDSDEEDGDDESELESEDQEH